MNSATVNGIDLPYIPDDLLKALDERFPNHWPSLDAVDREIWFAAGARSVVDYLLDQKRRQQEADDLEVIL